MNKTYILRLLETASVTLFFLQALKVIFSILFGIIYDQVFEGPIDTWLFISVLLVVVTFVAPAAIFRQPKSGFLAFLAAVAVVSRVVLTVNDPTISYWGSLGVLLAGGLYMAALYAVERSIFAPGLLLAITLDQTFRAAGYTYDVTLRPEPWPRISIAICTAGRSGPGPRRWAIASCASPAATAWLRRCCCAWRWWCWAVR